MWHDWTWVLGCLHGCLCVFWSGSLRDHICVRPNVHLEKQRNVLSSVKAQWDSDMLGNHSAFKIAHNLPLISLLRSSSGHTQYFPLGWWFLSCSSFAVFCSTPSCIFNKLSFMFYLPEAGGTQSELCPGPSQSLVAGCWFWENSLHRKEGRLLRMPSRCWDLSLWW